jgi:thiamine-phosphate pyrophosphorylase
MNSPIYFISQDIAGYKHADQIEDVCKAGVQMVQFRTKSLKPDQRLAEAKKIREICTNYRAFFIVNDDAQLAVDAEADGVHLGPDDMSVNDARNLLGPDRIIGYAANNLADITTALELDIDYLSIGPFKETTTKTDAGVPFGLEGYHQLFAQLPIHYNMPIFAVGGIQLDDVEPLARLPFSGIAASTMLITHNFKNLLVNHIKERFAQGKLVRQQITP